MKRPIERAATLLTLAVLLLLVGVAVWLAAIKRFSIDELDYAHAAWLVAHGQVPYRDFFDHHFPLLYLLLSPVFRLLGDRSTAILVLRWLMLVPLATILGTAAWLGRRAMGAFGAALAPAVLLLVPTFTRFAVEVRPDPLALALFLVALVLLATAGEHGREHWSGAALGLAVCSSQKVLVFGAGFAVVFVLGLIDRRGRRRAALRHPGRFLAGFLLALAPFFAWLAASRALGPFWIWCFRWSALHEHQPQAFSPLPDLLHVVVPYGWILALALVGFFALARRVEHPWQLVLLVGWPLAWISWALETAPYPYSMLPALALSGVLAPFGLAATARLLGRRGKGVQAAAPFAAAALALLCLVPFTLALRGIAVPDNAPQLRLLATLDRLTDPADPVYANSGSAVARPHPDFFYFTNAFLRRMLPARFAREVPRRILETGTVAWIRDIRFETLPPSLKAFLTRHFVPYDGDLWLWGEAFLPSEPPHPFLAVRTDEYFLLGASSIVVDGRRVGPAPFRLGKGEHRVEAAAGDRPFAILWLPRDGRRYVPQPGPPRFSTLF